MRNKYLITFFCFLVVGILHGQHTAEQLLDKSIKYHDPTSNWDSFKGQLSFTVERPDRPDGKRKVIIDNKKKEFSFWAKYDEGLLNYKVSKDKPTVLWNNTLLVPGDLAEKYRISADRAIMYRDYYTYLYGMPMKLKDVGTIIHPEVTLVDFYGKKYNKIKVTYDQEVGEDIWYFYFDTNTNSLGAYQFFHDESKNDGEYILFEEMIEIDKIKIPRIRKWYYNKDEKFLATDILEY